MEKCQQRSLQLRLWSFVTSTGKYQSTSKRVTIVVIGIALIVAMTMNGIPKAAALDQIHSSRQVSVSVDKVWTAIINLSTDPTWNQADSVKVIKKTGNVIEADTTVGPQNASAHKIITFHPKQSVITNVTRGPITGSRVIPFFAKGFAKDGFTKATEQSLNRLTQAVVG